MIFYTHNPYLRIRSRATTFFSRRERRTLSKSSTVPIDDDLRNLIEVRTGKTLECSVVLNEASLTFLTSQVVRPYRLRPFWQRDTCPS